MGRKKIQPKTCFVLGLIAAFPGFIAGVLIALGMGQASLPLVLSFVLYGAMVLFLSTTSPGKQQTAKRVRLLFVFILLVISYFNLPPLSGLAGALVLPLVACWYKEAESPFWWISLLALELAYAVVLTLAVTNFLPGNSAVIQGSLLAVLSVYRFWVLFRLYRQAAASPQPVAETPPRRLR